MTAKEKESRMLKLQLVINMHLILFAGYVFNQALNSEGFDFWVRIVITIPLCLGTGLSNIWEALKRMKRKKLNE